MDSLHSTNNIAQTQLVSESAGHESLYLSANHKTPEEINRMLSLLDNQPLPTDPPSLGKLMNRISDDINILKSQGWALGMLHFCALFYKNSIARIVAFKASQRQWLCDIFNATLDSKIERSLTQRLPN